MATLHQAKAPACAPSEQFAELVEEELCALEAIFGEDCVINRDERLVQVVFATNDHGSLNAINHECLKTGTATAAAAAPANDAPIPQICAGFMRKRATDHMGR